MTRAPLFAWACLVVWAVWLFALQGLWATSRFGAWVPDVGLVLLLGLILRVTPRRARWAAVWIAVARIAFGADPPVAVLAGYLGFVGFCRALRGAVELERPLVRAVLGGLGAALLAFFWTAAREIEIDRHGVSPHLQGFYWQSAAATALAALLLGALPARLPGLVPLWKRRGP